jgi:hypothetical protein
LMLLLSRFPPKNSESMLWIFGMRVEPPTEI